MDPFTIIFIGPQGSGKGTQIEKLSATLRAKDPLRAVVDVQTGRRFRALAQMRENYAEESVAQTIDTGAFQPLFLSVSLWGDAFRRSVTPNCHLLMDGFPRTVDEAIVLETALTFYERHPLTIIILDVPEEQVRVRMKQRARKDDTDEAIEIRLAGYREQTVPVVAYYRERPHTNVIPLDGTQSIDDVSHAVSSTLGIV
jgi:adenylate kinase